MTKSLFLAFFAFFSIPALSMEAPAEVDQQRNGDQQDLNHQLYEVIRNFDYQDPQQSIAAVQNLIALGADINRTGFRGETSLEVFLMFLYLQGELNNLSEVEKANAREICRGLIAQGVHVNIGAVERASIIPDRQLLELLLDQGVDLNTRYADGSTILFRYLGAHGDNNLFELFVARGADIQVGDGHGRTLLHHAILLGNLNICEYLLLNGLDVNARDNFGHAPLHLAHGYHIIRFLVDWGADLNQPDARGNTILHKAARLKNRRLCNLLMSRGANVSILNAEGHTPIAVASIIQPPEVLLYINEEDRYQREERRRLERIPVFQNSRQICQDMVVHQVMENRKVYALLGSLKQLGADGNDAGNVLYRYRNELLRPHLLQHLRPLDQALNQDAYGNLNRERAALFPDNNAYDEDNWDYDAYLGFLLPDTIAQTQILSRRLLGADGQQGGMVPLNNLNIYEGLEAPRIIEVREAAQAGVENINNDNNALDPRRVGAPVRVELPRIAHLYPPLNPPVELDPVEPLPVDQHPVQPVPVAPVAGPAVTEPAASVSSAGSPDAPRTEADISSSKKPWGRGIVIVAVAGVVCGAIYKLYKWVDGKKAKPEKKKIIKKQVAKKKAVSEDLELQAA